MILVPMLRLSRREALICFLKSGVSRRSEFSKVQTWRAPPPPSVRLVCYSGSSDRGSSLEYVTQLREKQKYVVSTAFLSVSSATTTRKLARLRAATARNRCNCSGASSDKRVYRMGLASYFVRVTPAGVSPRLSARMARPSTSLFFPGYPGDVSRCSRGKANEQLRIGGFLGRAGKHSASIRVVGSGCSQKEGVFKSLPSRSDCYADY